MTTNVFNTVENNNRVNNSFVLGTRLTREEIQAHTADNESPALYIGTYHKYNCGSLRGLWVDLTSFDDIDSFYEFLRAFHADEADPEFMAQDYQNFPKMLYSESLDLENVEKIMDLFSSYDDNEREAIFEYWDEIDSTCDASDILDKLAYNGEFSDYAAMMADEQLFCANCEDWVKNYFDYSAFERDLRFDYHITDNYVFHAY